MSIVGVKKGLDIIVIIIVLHFLMSYSALFVEDLRYLKYTLPFIALLLRNTRGTSKEEYWTFKAKSYIHKYTNFYVPLFLIYFFIQAFNGQISFRFWANISFVLLPLFLVWLLIPVIRTNRIKNYVLILCFGTILGFIIEQRSTIGPTIMQIGKLVNAITDSEVETESNIYSSLLSLLLVFTVYFKYPKSLKLLLATCVILSFKRIIFLSLLIVAIISKFDLLINFTLKHKRLSASIFATISLALIFIYFLLVRGYFDDYVYQQLGMSTDALLKGRQKLYTLALRSFDESSFIWGNGIGYIDDLLRQNSIFVGNVKNLHSELLRWFIETGPIAYFIWIYLLFKNSLAGKYAIVSFIFIYIMLLTDNVFIYFDTMFYFYLLTIFSFSLETVKSRVRYQYQRNSSIAQKIN